MADEPGRQTNNEQGYQWNSIVTSSSELEHQHVKAVLRLLNGPLCGCEYRLGDGATLVVAAAASALLGSSGTQGGGAPAQMPDFPENAIVVAMEGGRNFEIVIDDNARDGFWLRVLEPRLEERAQAYQKVCRVGALAFAVRPAQADWAPGISSGMPASCAEGRRPPRRGTRLAKTQFGAIAALALLALGLALWMMLKDDTRVASVAATVAGSSDQYRLLKGRDGAIHLFARSERDASWARQALAREGLAGSARVSTARAEEARLTKLLVETYPVVAFLRLKLDDPRKPVLVLSRQRGWIDGRTRQALTASLKAWMPYAQDIGIASWSDAMLDERARTGLDLLGIRYERVGNAGSVTYTVQSGLDDIELARLQEFTENFYRDFGARYVYFSVSLKDDWLKGKSFKYGAAGYVKLTPQHWFFPQPF
ncbi:PrgH/EprH family type III secretion apparatus protein [Xanthomonas theicola]|uniref:PrgH/EprH family type III secretion apparatus protein n=1 Tax=Xanthomonas theicola TaxID=56464 RepID=A0A2S6ZDW6_9XANT|nr:PrgH/EprH family type III secretion apparatus protein [Xanthomonas theicola]PPT90458.1 hypothetical protein XthCFBP4691_12330 [Xanthomonas theicola]QNH25236.1 PrgH/EprH family type III secretion apparatus protein [Xanthomonas theicola]